MKFLDPSEFRTLTRVRRRHYGVKFTNSDPTIIASDDRTFRFLFSDSQVDRQGDRLLASGWDTRDFEVNPVVLWSHDVEQPIGRASNLKIEDGALYVDITFAETGLADEICELVRGNFIKAVSVGFKPQDYRYVDDPDRNGGVDFTRMSLLEVSLCAIPVNPRALIEARSAGIPTDNLKSWLQDRVTSKTTSATDRVVYKSFLNTGKDMTETDPESGGDALQESCGRSEDEPCGYLEDCVVHRQLREEEDQTLMQATRAVKAAQAEIKRLNSLLLRKAEDEGDDNGRPDEEADEHYEDMVKALVHLKAARMHHKMMDEHHEECERALRLCFGKAMNDGDDDEDDRFDNEDKSDDEEDEVEKIKARAVAGMSR